MAKLHPRDTCNYGDLSGVNISTLLELRRSPKHYRHLLANPKPPTSAMRLGTAAHIAVLEPERFLREFCMWTERKSNGDMMPRKGPKWETFLAANPGKEAINEKDYDDAVRISKAVRASRYVMKYLAVGEPEVTLEWTDKRTGIGCKGRVDWITEIDGKPFIVDLKTAASIERDKFPRSATKLDYHLRMAFYADGYETITGKAPGVAVPVVESKPPHDAATYLMPDDVLDIGRDEYGLLLDTLKDCLAEDVWPGIGDRGEITFELPPYAVPQDDTGLDDLGLVGWQESA